MDEDLGTDRGDDGGGAPGDPAEARADELGDLADTAGAPGRGVTDAEPGAATEKHAASGASTGTDPLGSGNLDEGAASQVTGTSRAGDEEGGTPR